MMVSILHSNARFVAKAKDHKVPQKEFFHHSNHEVLRICKKTLRLPIEDTKTPRAYRENKQTMSNQRNVMVIELIEIDHKKLNTRILDYEID